MILLLMEASFLPVAVGFALKGWVGMLRAGCIHPTPDGGWIARAESPIQYWSFVGFIALMIVSGTALVVFHLCGMVATLRGEIGM